MQGMVEQAVALFGEFGFEATTVDDIAAAAGCSQRTFYRHFASKKTSYSTGCLKRLSALTRLLDVVPADESAWAAVRDSLRQMTRQFTGEDPPDRGQDPPVDDRADALRAVDRHIADLGAGARPLPVQPKAGCRRVRYRLGSRCSRYYFGDPGSVAG
jgi:AcrR family transcriptional regulator